MTVSELIQHLKQVDQSLQVQALLPGDSEGMPVDKIRTDADSGILFLVLN